MILDAIFGGTISSSTATLYGPGIPSAAGETVSQRTSLGLSVYFACLRNISEDIAKLPVDVIRRTGETRQPVDGHAIARLLNVAPNPHASAMSFRECLTQWAMGWGGGYAHIQRDGRGVAQQLWPIHPSNCWLKYDTNGNIYAEIRGRDNVMTQVPYDDLFHLHGLGNDALTGYSVMEYGADSIGAAIALQRYAAGIFAGGGVDKLALVLPDKRTLSEAGRQNLRDSWAEAYGRAGNTKPVILEEGLTAARIGIPPENAQMIESREFSVNDIARWFRCPPAKVQQFVRAQGWSTLEMLDMEYARDTLLPWTIRWAQETARKLFMPSERNLQLKHNFGIQLATDAKTRGEFYATQFKMGTLNRNEIRALEDRNPVEGGDTYYVDSTNVKPVRVDENGEVVVEQAQRLGPDGKPIAGEGATTLNGAQITAAIEVMAKLREGTLTPLAATELLTGIGIPADRAAAIVNGTPILDTAAADIEFKRQAWLAVHAKGGIVANDSEKAVDAAALTMDVGLAVTEKPEEPEPMQPTGNGPPDNSPTGPAGQTEPDEPAEPETEPEAEPEQPEKPENKPEFAATSSELLTEVFAPLMADAVERCLRREVNQVQGAKRRFLDKGRIDEFSDWVVTFYDDECRHIADTVEPVFTAVARASHGQVATRALAVDYSARHCDESKLLIEDLASGLRARAESAGRREVEAAALILGTR